MLASRAPAWIPMGGGQAHQSLLARLALAPGDTLLMEISRGILMLPVAYRTADSADEIRLTQRAINNVSISADKEISATLSARGVWL